MNQIMTIRPYWHEGTWVFDDPEKGLDKEPFVAGVPAMLTYLARDIVLDEETGELDPVKAQRGFRLLFSGSPFPGYQHCAIRRDQEYGGWYYSVELSDELLALVEAAGNVVLPELLEHVIVEIEGKKHFKGWLCSALFKFFDEAPERLFVKAEPIAQ